MKILWIFIIVAFFSISYISAIRINEVELNPSGSDSGNEWIELYSTTETNLSGFSIMNNDGEEINLSGLFSGYYVYILDKQWLDNSDEKVVLYKEGNLLEETPIFEDSKNGDFTFNFCNSSWIFMESSKGEKNKCQIGRAHV